MYDGESLPVVGRLVSVAACLIAVAGCGVQPLPSGTPAPSIASTPEDSPSSGADIDLSEVGWFEVERGFDTEGGASRRLVLGHLGGEVVRTIELGTFDGRPNASGVGAFGTSDPQANGIFQDRILVWMRQGAIADIEAVSVSDGAIAPLVQDAGGVVHAAAADMGLSRLFYVVVNETGVPTGLFMDEIDNPLPPRRLPLEFAPGEVGDGGRRYRLTPNADGSRLVVDGPDMAVLVEVDTGVTHELDLGGEVLGLAADTVLAYGLRSQSDLRAVVAIEVPSLRRRVVAEDVTSARVALDTGGRPVLVLLREARDGSGTSTISVALIETGAERVLYEVESGATAAMLPSPERAFHSADVPPGWVLLANTFLPFVESDEGRPPPDGSEYPRLLGLATGEVVPLGPFASRPEASPD